MSNKSNKIYTQLIKPLEKIKNSDNAIFGCQLILYKDKKLDISRTTNNVDIDSADFLAAIHMGVEDMLTQAGFDPVYIFGLFKEASEQKLSQEKENGNEKRKLNEQQF